MPRPVVSPGRRPARARGPESGDRRRRGRRRTAQGVVDAARRQRVGDRPGRQVEEVLVAAAGLEVDPAQGAQRVEALGDHPHGVVGQPARPHVVAQPPGGDLERQLPDGRALGVGRVGAGTRVHLQRGTEHAVVEAVGSGERVQHLCRRPVEVIAQRPGGPREGRQVADLEQRVTRQRGAGAEHVGALHGGDERAVAARRVAGDPPVRAVGQRRIVGVDERHDLVAQVVEVGTGRRGVDELRAAERGPGVDEHHERRRARPRGEHRVEALDPGELEARPVQPLVELPGERLEQVDRWQGRGRPRRAEDVERAAVGIAQRVAVEQLRFDREPVQGAGQLAVPGRPGGTAGLTQRHRPDSRL
jgi:hypothetical protein